MIFGSANHSLHDLTARYTSGRASRDDVRQLNAILMADAAARRTFLELCNVESGLQEQAVHAVGVVPLTPPARSPRGSLPPWAAAVLVGLASAAAAAAAVARWSGVGEPQVATVVRFVGDATTLPRGPVAAGRRYEMQAGTAEIVTATGVQVVIEAPATFMFESPQKLQLERGRLSANVPPSGTGFTVGTPTGKAIDLGTRFGVDVDAAGSAEVHVFEGEVIAENAEGRKSSLRDGEALALAAGGPGRKTIRSAAFIQDDEVASLQAGFAAGQMARSQNQLDRMRRDPAAIAVFDFEGPELPPGQFMIVQGRWPGSKAPDFAQLGDHMQVTLGEGQTYTHLTLAAWVRLDQVRGFFQSLFQTDRYFDGVGYAHWSLNDVRTMRFSVQGAMPEVGRRNESDSVRSLVGDVGRWLHLVAVYDSEAGTVRLYVDGRLDRESRLLKAPPAVLGRGQFGNWKGQPPLLGQDRRLSGRMDEFVALGRAMSDEEVRELHDAGTPYR
jgi:ferric-dicitrate binding protein FerR (iron transport regulator)